MRGRCRPNEINSLPSCTVDKDHLYKRVVRSMLLISRILRIQRLRRQTPAMKIAIAFVLAVVLACSEGKVASTSEVESQQTGSQPVQLTDLINQAQTSINTLGRQIQEQLNLPNQETVVNAFKEQSTTFVQRLNDFVGNVSEEVKTKNPELENLWGNVKATLAKVAEDINAQIPNAQEQLTQLQSTFQEGIQTIVKESNKAAKALNENSEKVQEDIAKYTKDVINLAVGATETLNNKLKEAAAAAPAS